MPLVWPNPLSLRPKPTTSIPAPNLATPDPSLPFLRLHASKARVFGCQPMRYPNPAAPIPALGERDHPHCASPQGNSSVLCMSRRRTVRWTPSSARRPVWPSTRPTCGCAVSWPCARWSTPIGETGNAGLGGRGQGSRVFICSSICPSSKRTEDQLWAKCCAGCRLSRQRSEAWPLPSEGFHQHEEEQIRYKKATE